jgi:hypothetical protein
MVKYASRFTNHKAKLYYTLPVSTARLVLTQAASAAIGGIIIFMLNVGFMAVQYEIYWYNSMIAQVMMGSPNNNFIVGNISLVAIIIWIGVFLLLFFYALLTTEYKCMPDILKWYLPNISAPIIGFLWVYGLTWAVYTLRTDYSHGVLVAFIALAVLIPIALCMASIHLISKKRGIIDL